MRVASTDRRQTRQSCLCAHLSSTPIRREGTAPLTLNVWPYTEVPGQLHPSSFTPVSHSMEFFPRGYSGRSVKRVTHPRLMPRLGMGGATPILPVYAFRVGTGTKLPLSFTDHQTLCCTRNVVLYSFVRNWAIKAVTSSMMNFWGCDAVWFGKKRLSAL